MSIPRPEYPRPQFVRQDWLCLNGDWQFEVDHADTGLERGVKDRDLTDRILVPFCPESTLSGIGNTDFMEAVWYRREVRIPRAWQGRHAVLHFQAVDYDATVWVNGVEVGRHRGGFSPFACDLRGVVKPGEMATIVVRARDPRGEPKPGGKQSNRYGNYGCLYTRTTGIWQTVWLEPVPEVFLKRPRITPDVANSCFHVVQPVSSNPKGLRVRVTLRDKQGRVAVAESAADLDFAARLTLKIPKRRVRLWGAGEPNLYDVVVELLDANGTVVDRAESYAGLRSVAIDGKAVTLNGKPVFQRQVLDQGYYADGIMTAPSDAALRRDIGLSIAAGFNSARLHQKVFEERFLYHADRLGYLVWGEFGDWGCRPWEQGRPLNGHRHQPAAALMAQWLEVLERDVSHPCIIGWCPLNETHQDIEDHLTSLDDMTRGLFLATKAMDLSRPVLDTSGYSHREPEADIYDCHDYQQDATKLQQNQAGLADGKPYSNNVKWSVPYRGQPFFVSEFGGIWWNPDAKPGEASWGYGDRPKSIEEFYSRFEGLCNVLLDNPDMFGYCYTQLTDVFQEQNGIYRFDRRPKFDLKRLRLIQGRSAAIEAQRA
ncbi:MAG: beta-galactosidase [Lentisphaerae bacterium RIFOXYB12_FULL_65_16]|nr:MAG: beta-galactosidase [Lentisphaerae bacterium RIFOXYA12_64_32]OGV91387.1 MAG: beta-galactosidase [Lentisphaerae bacterium RIFOXYB12_FULL_65_16]